MNMIGYSLKKRAMFVAAAALMAASVAFGTLFYQTAMAYDSEGWETYAKLKAWTPSDEDWASFEATGKTLTVNVSYYGMSPVFSKEITAADFKSMNLYADVYTKGDRLEGAVRYDLAYGISVEDLMSELGVDTSRIERLMFTASDNYDPTKTNTDIYTWENLNADRYFYLREADLSNLNQAIINGQDGDRYIPDNLRETFEEYGAREAVQYLEMDSPQIVKTMLALFSSGMNRYDSYSPDAEDSSEQEKEMYERRLSYRYVEKEKLNAIIPALEAIRGTDGQTRTDAIAAALLLAQALSDYEHALIQRNKDYLGTLGELEIRSAALVTALSADAASVTDDVIFGEGGQLESMKYALGQLEIEIATNEEELAKGAYDYGGKYGFMSFANNYEMSVEDAIQLEIGENYPYEPVAQYNISNVNTIQIRYSGSPSVSANVDPDLENDHDISGWDVEKNGYEYQLKPKVDAADDVLTEYFTQGLEFKTSDPTVATVDNTGKITINGKGTVTITVTITKEVSSSMEKTDWSDSITLHVDNYEADGSGGEGTEDGGGTGDGTGDGSEEESGSSEQESSSAQEESGAGGDTGDGGGDGTGGGSGDGTGSGSGSDSGGGSGTGTGTDGGTGNDGDSGTNGGSGSGGDPSSDGDSGATNEDSGSDGGSGATNEDSGSDGGSGGTDNDTASATAEDTSNPTDGTQSASDDGGQDSSDVNAQSVNSPQQSTQDSQTQENQSAASGSDDAGGGDVQQETTSPADEVGRNQTAITAAGSQDDDDTVSVTVSTRAADEGDDVPTAALSAEDSATSSGKVTKAKKITRAQLNQALGIDDSSSGDSSEDSSENDSSSGGGGGGGGSAIVLEMHVSIWAGIAAVLLVGLGGAWEYIGYRRRL